MKSQVKEMFWTLALMLLFPKVSILKAGKNANFAVYFFYFFGLTLNYTNGWKIKVLTLAIGPSRKKTSYTS